MARRGWLLAGAVAASAVALVAGYLLVLSLLAFGSLDKLGPYSGLMEALWSTEILKVAAVAGAVTLLSLIGALSAGRSWRRERLT